MKLFAVPLTLLALALAGCDLPPDAKKAPTNDPCMLQAENIRAGITKAQLEAQLELARNFTSIQLAVAKSCSEHGRIPVFQGGNVDCKAGPR